MEALRDNVARSDVPANVYSYALSNENGESELTFEGTAGHSGILSDTFDDSVTVQLRRVDDLIADGEVPVPNVVKIDVKGAEYDVLKGMRETLAREECRFVYCEAHDGILDVDTSELVVLLEETGFEVTEEQHIWARKDAAE
jgi:FkbM family methyltransferase